MLKLEFVLNLPEKTSTKTTQPACPCMMYILHSKSLKCVALHLLQVVMPTVDADVAFGLGKFNLPNDEVRSKVQRALHAVGLSDYMKVLSKLWITASSTQTNV